MRLYLGKNNTQNVNNILNNEFKNKNIIFCKEFISHDGCDNLGWQSNIYDLIIIIEENNNLIFYNYHCEDWFSDSDNVEYYLTDKKNLCDMNLLDLDYIYKYIDNIKLKKIFDEKYNIVV